MGNLPPWKPLIAPPKATPAPRGNAGSRRNYVPPKAPQPDLLSNSPIPLLHPPVKKATPQPRVPKDASVPTPLTPKRSPAPKAAPKPAPRPAQLPTTSGKTTVPVRSVTPHPVPTPKANPAAPVVPKKAPPVRRPAAPAPATPQQSPEDAASAAVTAALAPLYAAQGTQASGQNSAITNLTQAVIKALSSNPAQIGGEYDQAIGQQTNLSNAAADALRAANPNTQNQALLSAINAPQEQRDQLAAQNSAAFNGGAAVGQYVGGVLPMDTLQSQKLAAMGIAHQQPVIEGLRGQQSLLAALNAQGVERSKIDAMRPDLIQRYTAANQSAQNAQIAQGQKQDYLDMARQRLGLQAQGQSFNQNLAVSKQNTSIAKFNAQQTAKANKIDVTVSKSIPGGIARNSNGDPIVRGGKVITINANGTTTAKVPTASQISGFVDKWKSGKTQSVTTVAKDADGNPVYDQNGTPKTVTQTVESTKPMGYGQAYRRLRAMGLGDVKAREYLNTSYARGEQGRAWVTNREQSVLSKAGLPPRARVMTKADGTKIGVLTGAQYHALTSAGLQVPASPTADGVWIIQQVN